MVKRILHIAPLLSLLILSSCGISDHFNSSLEATVSSLYMPQVVLTKLMVENSMEIYRLDSIKEGKAIHIKHCNAHFENYRISYDLSADSCTVTAINDSLFFDELVLPAQRYLWPTDSAIVIFTYQYSMDSLYSQLNCLTRSYEIINGDIRPTSELNKCSF